MRLTCFGIVLVLLAGFSADRTNAQIPERTLFQPGSYAKGPAYQQLQQSPQSGIVATETMLVEVPDEENDAKDASEDESKTDWEKNFEIKKPATKLVEVPAPFQSFDGEFAMEAPYKTPYLAYHRCPITHRIHVVPYQPGYAEAPDQFPKHQSCLNLWLSSLPCRTQDRPQIKYLGYYDEMPEILEDKPSRLQLLLGYPDAQWTASCNNPTRGKIGYCPRVEAIPCGPYAEPSIRQLTEQMLPPGQPIGGVFKGVRPIEYGPMGPPPRQRLFRGEASPCPTCPNCPQVVGKPEPYPYIAAPAPQRELFAKPVAVKEQSPCPTCPQPCQTCPKKPCPVCEQKPCSNCEKKPCNNCGQKSCMKCSEQKPCDGFCKQKSCKTCSVKSEGGGFARSARSTKSGCGEGITAEPVCK